MVTFKFARFGEYQRVKHVCYPKVDKPLTDDLGHWAHFARIKKNMVDDESLETWGKFMLDSIPQTSTPPPWSRSIPQELVMGWLLDWEQVEFDEACDKIEHRFCGLGPHTQGAHKAKKWAPPKLKDAT
jgi:hypothetical protein